MHCPSKKTCHQTKQQAMRQIRSSEKRGKVTNMRAYKCPICGWFHVTHSVTHKKPLIKY